MTPTIPASELMAEVQDFIQDIIQDGKTYKASWITHQVVSRHMKVYGEDADWYVTCAFEAIRSDVRHVLRKFKGIDGPATKQLVLPGFERLQRLYLIERDGEEELVPIDQCTKPELMTKANECRAMAAGCTKHAEELERYCRTRWPNAAS